VFSKRNIIKMIIILLMSIATPGVNQERTIKPGDAIEIIVYDHEKLCQIVTVSNEGTVDYPTLEGFPVDGITLQRFQEILVTQLSRYMTEPPLIKTRFSEKYPIKVSIMGLVANPDSYTLFNTTTLQKAIQSAGGLISGAQLSKIKINRKNGSTQIVNMEAFYLTADPATLPVLKDGDTIIVPGNPLAKTVKVLGSVERPGSYEISFQTSLLDVIYMAGGPSNDANLNGTRIVSFVEQDVREVRINFKDLLKSKAFQSIPNVMPGDVIYIPEKTITWSKFVEFIRDVSTFAVLYYFIRISTR